MKLSPYPTHGSMSLGVTLGMNFVKQTSRLKYVGEFVRDCRCFELKVLNYFCAYPGSRISILTGSFWIISLPNEVLEWIDMVLILVWKIKIGMSTPKFDQI